MRKLGLCLALAGLWALGACGGGRLSGDVGRACVTSGRAAAGAAVCSCVQGVADQTLGAADQRRAAAFFANPDAAQVARASDSAADEAFWRRYRGFADRAAAVCDGFAR